MFRVLGASNPQKNDQLLELTDMNDAAIPSSTRGTGRDSFTSSENLSNAISTISLSSASNPLYTIDQQPAFTANDDNSTWKERVR
jgi:hypothetical protein